MKQLANNKDIEISDEIKQNIIEFFFIEYLNNNNIDLSNNIEEKLIQTILNYCKEDLVEDQEINTFNKMRDTKICKKLKRINLSFINLIKEKKITKINLEDLKVILISL
jgi:hypothetical protein